MSSGGMRRASAVNRDTLSTQFSSQQAAARGQTGARVSFRRRCILIIRVSYPALTPMETLSIPQEFKTCCAESTLMRRVIKIEALPWRIFISASCLITG